MRKTVLKYTVAAFVISAAGFAGFNYIGGHGHVAEASEAAEAHTAPMAMPVDVTTIKAQQVELWKRLVVASQKFISRTDSMLKKAMC